jgi:hypothetical protein
MRRIPVSILFVALMTFMVLPAWAQTTEPQVPGNEQIAPRLDPKACRDRDRLRLGDTVENEGAAPRQSDNPSDRLARTDGVICPPPEVDPDIRAPAPQQPGTMPVIPPPGSPGGDPSVRPK